MTVRREEAHLDGEKIRQNAVAVRRIQGEKEGLESQKEREMADAEETLLQSQTDPEEGGQCLGVHLGHRVRIGEGREGIETGREIEREIEEVEEGEMKEIGEGGNGVSLPKGKSRLEMES